VFVDESCVLSIAHRGRCSAEVLGKRISLLSLFIADIATGRVRNMVDDNHESPESNAGQRSAEPASSPSAHLRSDKVPARAGKYDETPDLDNVIPLNLVDDIPARAGKSGDEGAE
jgi:hypothetical protein